MHSLPHTCRRGFTLLELGISLLLIALLLSIMLPLLSSARVTAHREHCASNQRLIGQAWQTYLSEHGRTFPYVADQPGWRWGGVNFSAVGAAVPDYSRPLTNYLPLHGHPGRSPESLVCSCPADRGITGPDATVGTGQRTAFRSYGTSFRINASLVNARLAIPGLDELDNRGMRRDEITTAQSRLVVMGDPVWFEVAENTSRHADWHGEPNAGNLLFLDGSVRFMTVRSRRSGGPMLFDPIMPTPQPKNATTSAELSNADEP